MIQIRNLHKRLGRRDVLQGIDLSIERGQRIALVGSNGAGKTTLIRCLLGEYTRDGDIHVDGSDPRLDRTGVLHRVGFVPQLPPPLKVPVGQLIRYVSAVCGAAEKRIGDVAARLGLEVDQFRHQPFVRLSGGQKQKLLIALALGRDVDILILDEPAANLDPEARAIFFQLLAAREKDSMMLISSHRLDEVATLVNRVVELDQGRIVLDDRVADVIDLASRLRCRIRINRPEPAFARAIEAWGFADRGNSLVWEGFLAGPDRLRFLGMLSRYTALLADLEMHEERDGNDRREAANA